MIALLPLDTTYTFPIDTSVFHFNKQKGFDASEILKGYFSALSTEEIFALKRGDIIWVNEEESYHSRGWVHGYTKRMVTSTTTLGDGGFRMTLGRESYAKFTPAGVGKSIVRVHDETALKNILLQLSPFAARIY